MSVAEIEIKTIPELKREIEEKRKMYKKKKDVVKTKWIRRCFASRIDTLDLVLTLINSLEARVRKAIIIIDKCSENETHLDDELCKKCPLYSDDEAGIFCSYWVLRRILEGEG